MFIRFKLIVLFLVTFISPILLAQSDQIPFDKAVRRGQLDNGLEYFIRQNKRPASKVELRLVVNAGSLQEADSQQGLAHFVEHMAFNGTKNFKKNDLVDYLQSVGVKFGAHLNAYTSFDETVYMLSLPSDDLDILRKGFQVLRDWAGNLSFDPEEIDKERGVVIEEWRLGLGADERMQQKYFPILFKDSRYAERLPIGKKEIIEQASYETIRKFYRDWYRPDLMAVIVVGEIEIKLAEDLIKNLFEDLKNPAESPKRLVYNIPDHKETLISIASDKENPYSLLQIFQKTAPESYTTTQEFKKLMAYQLYTDVLNMRLTEYINKPNPPFTYAAINYNNHLTRTKASFTSFSLAKENDFDEALKILLEENKRISTHGVTSSELSRFKTRLLNRYKNAYNERDRTESGDYAAEYIRVFLENEPSPGIAYEYEFCQQYLSTISLEEVSNLAHQWSKPQNTVIVALSPEKENLSLPQEANFRQVIQNVANQKLDAYRDEIGDTALITKPLSKGTIVKTKYFKRIDTYQWILSNGAKVVFKPTDFKNQVLMSAYSLGGHSLYDDEDYFSALYASEINKLSGVGKFSLTQLQKLLTGKLVNVNPYIDALTEGLFANSTPEDIETMFQLCHLYFTTGRQSEEAVENFKNRVKSMIANLLVSPVEVYNQEIQRIMSQDHLRGNYIPLVEDLDNIDSDKAFHIFKERFANAADFTFFIVGQIDKTRLETLVNQYLANLPSKANSAENWKDRNLRPPKGIIKKTIYKGQEPQSYVNLIFTGEGAAYTIKDRHILKSLTDVLNIKFIEELREAQGGVYGINATGTIERDPYSNYEITIAFPCAPEKVDTLVKSVFVEIQKIKDQGISAKDLNKIKKTQQAEYNENLLNNNYWLNTLFRSYYYDTDPDDILNFNKKIDKLSSKAIQAAARKYLNFSNYAQIVLKPEK